MGIKTILIFWMLSFSSAAFSGCYEDLKQLREIEAVLESVGQNKTEHSKNMLSQGALATLSICINEARYGNPISQLSVAEMYYYGIGVNKSLADAIYWYTMSARSGIAGAMVMLGNIFLTEETVSKDISTAYYWFVKAKADEPQFTQKFCGQFTKDLSKEDILKIENLVMTEHGLSKLGTCYENREQKSGLDED